MTTVVSQFGHGFFFCERKVKLLICSLPRVMPLLHVINMCHFLLLSLIMTYENQLAVVAMSTSEAASAAANCLLELSKFSTDEVDPTTSMLEQRS